MRHLHLCQRSNDFFPDLYLIIVLPRKTGPELSLSLSNPERLLVQVGGGGASPPGKRVEPRLPRGRRAL